MIVLNDKYNRMMQTESKPKTYKITCEHCGSELEVEDDDVQVGAYGMGYVVCPCCGEKTYSDELADYFPLTKDNLKFPTHYTSSSSDGVHINDDTINKWVKECIDKFDPNDENDWCRFTGSGDTMVFVFKFYTDEEYDVYVCKNYYETFMPFDKNND
jgi:hypothetical protein